MCGERKGGAAEGREGQGGRMAGEWGKGWKIIDEGAEEGVASRGKGKAPQVTIGCKT